MSAYPSSPTTSTGGWRRGEDTTTTSAEETTTAPEHEPEPTKPKTTKPEPEPKPDPAAELKNAIKDRLGDSNRDVHRITVKAAAKAGKPINVKVAFDDNLDVQPGPHQVPEDVVAILKVVDEDADWKYSEVVVRGTFSMVDAYGDAKESQVVFARYSRKTVNRIDFDNFLSTNIWKIADARPISPRVPVIPLRPDPRALGDWSSRRRVPADPGSGSPHSSSYRRARRPHQPPARSHFLRCEPGAVGGEVAPSMRAAHRRASLPLL